MNKYPLVNKDGNNVKTGQTIVGDIVITKAHEIYKLVNKVYDIVK